MIDNFAREKKIVTKEKFILFYFVLFCFFLAYLFTFFFVFVAFLRNHLFQFTPMQELLYFNQKINFFSFISFHFFIQFFLSFSFFLYLFAFFTEFFFFGGRKGRIQIYLHYLLCARTKEAKFLQIIHFALKLLFETVLIFK